MANSPNSLSHDNGVRKPVCYDLTNLGKVRKRDTLSGRREGEQAQLEYGIGNHPKEKDQGVKLLLPSSIRAFTPSFFMRLLWLLATKYGNAREAKSMITLVDASQVTQQSLEHAVNTLLSPRSPLSAFAIQSEKQDKQKPGTFFARKGKWRK